MVYNPQTLRWEGNENTLSSFDVPAMETPTPPSHERSDSSFMGRHQGSPSRPALISQVPTSNGHNVQVQNGMVYDPQQMKWLKFKGGRDVSGQLSPSVTEADEEEDAFAGIEDLRDENTPLALVNSSGDIASPGSVAGGIVGEVHEEFDLGPRFIQLQRDEEIAWRRRCERWFSDGNSRPDDGKWRWQIRDIVPRDLDGF